MADTTLNGPGVVFDHPKWKEGDLTLISADNVGFHVRARTLFAVSDVLADAAEAAGAKGRVLRLTDPELEQSDAVDHFLDLAINAALPPTSAYDRDGEQLKTCQRIIKVVGLIHKYECAALMRQLHLCLIERIMKHALAPMVAFVVGAVANDIDLSSTALRKACGRPPIRLSGLDRPEMQVCGADPGHLPHAMWSLIPPQWAWAWNKGWAAGDGAVEHRTVEQHDLDFVALEFRKAVVSLKNDSP